MISRYLVYAKQPLTRRVTRKRPSAALDQPLVRYQNLPLKCSEHRDTYRYRATTTPTGTPALVYYLEHWNIKSLKMFFPMVCTRRWLSAMRITPKSNRILTRKVNVWDYSFTSPHFSLVRNHSLTKNRVKESE